MRIGNVSAVKKCCQLLQDFVPANGLFVRSMSAVNSAKLHQPVMLKEVLDNLYSKPGDVILDMTFGAGGHSEAILQRFETCKLIALDRDPIAYDYAQKLSKRYRDRVLPLLGRFSDLDDILMKNGINKIDGAVIDAGCSSMQFDSVARGFGLSTDGPLDMRMDGNRLCSDKTPSAADVVNNLSSQDLKRIFELYGEEKHAEGIAKMIVHHRKTSGPILTTKQLAKVIESAVVGFRMDACGRRIHVATKCFMALRIFVNDELNELRTGLQTIEKYMARGGRVVVITFHSLEDKIVKEFLLGKASSRSKDADKEWLVLKKKVVVPQFADISANSRARSAKLRSATKI